jgi:hypothetical protein
MRPFLAELHRRNVSEGSSHWQPLLALAAQGEGRVAPPVAQ